jgi:hypothetical protein
MMAYTPDTGAGVIPQYLTRPDQPTTTAPVAGPKKSGQAILGPVGHFLAHLLPGNPLGKDPSAPAFGAVKGYRLPGSSDSPSTSTPPLEQQVADSSWLSDFGYTAPQVKALQAWSTISGTKLSDLIKDPTKFAAVTGSLPAFAAAKDTTTASPEDIASIVQMMSRVQEPYLAQYVNATKGLGSLMRNNAKNLPGVYQPFANAAADFEDQLAQQNVGLQGASLTSLPWAYQPRPVYGAGTGSGASLVASILGQTGG